MALDTTELPPYRALLVVDVKDFSGKCGRDHSQLTEAIPEVLRKSFRRCELADLWEEALFQGSTGDGYYLGFNSRFLPYLLNPFLPALQEEIAHRNSLSQQTVRMRVSVNVGPMTGTGENTISDGSGDARIETHRLLDSEPVRDLLDRSGTGTCVAAAVSARAFEDAVVAGYSEEDPGLYVPVPVRVKSYRGTAYLRVPHPSGDLLSKGFHPEEAAAPASRENFESNSASGNTASDVHGPVAQGAARIGDGFSDVSGDGHRMTNVRGDQHNGDRYHGSQHSSTHYEGPQDHSTHHDGDGDGHLHINGNTHGNIQQNFGGKTDR